MRNLNEDMVRDIGIHALGGGLAGAALNALHNNSMSYSHAITQGGIFGALGGLTLSLASQIVNRFLGKRERRVDVSEESLNELPDKLVEEIKALNLPEEFYSSPEWEEVEVYIREIINKPELAEDADTTPSKLIASLIMVSFVKWKREQDGNKEPLKEDKGYRLPHYVNQQKSNMEKWGAQGAAYGAAGGAVVGGTAAGSVTGGLGIPAGMTIGALAGTSLGALVGGAAGFANDHFFGNKPGEKETQALNKFTQQNRVAFEKYELTPAQIKTLYRTDPSSRDAVFDSMIKDKKGNKFIKDDTINNTAKPQDNQPRENKPSNNISDEQQRKIDGLDSFERGNSNGTSNYSIKTGTITQAQKDAVSESYAAIVESWVLVREDNSMFGPAPGAAARAPKVDPNTMPGLFATRSDSNNSFSTSSTPNTSSTSSSSNTTTQTNSTQANNSTNNNANNNLSIKASTIPPAANNNAKQPESTEITVS